MILTNILEQFRTATGGWSGLLFPIANHLFFLLAVIEVTWIGIRAVLSQDDATELTGKFLLNIIGIGFFYALLLNSEAWLGAIIGGFVRAGELAASTGELNPSAVIDQGLAIAMNVYATLGLYGTFRDPAVTFISAWAVVIILICFAIIAGLMLVALISMYFTISSGVLLLGFGGSRWTRPIVERFLSRALAIGMKLFVLYLIIGVGGNIAQQWAVVLKERAGQDMGVYGEVMIGSIVFALITWRIPNEASDLMTGVFSFNTHEAERMGTGALSAGMMAAPAVGGAMQVVGGTAANAVSTLAGAIQTGGTKAASFFNGGRQGGSPPASGGGSPSPQSSAALTQFQNAGTSQSGTPPAGGTSPSTPQQPPQVNNPELQATLNKWKQRGEKS